MLGADCFLRDICLKTSLIDSFDCYPFSLPAVQKLNRIEFHPAVTFIIGENGTGKSTLLEALAVATGFNPEGGSKNLNFQTESTHSALHQYLKVTKGYRRPDNGYFFRAESFYNVASEIDNLDREPGLGRPVVKSYGGVSLHCQSHGESFMSLVVNRFSGNGLYLLDEPEAALSPSRQMAFLTRLHELVKAGSQFVIATHSPIIITYPNSKIIHLSNQGYQELSYDQTEHYSLTRDFLNCPEQFLRHLLE